MPVNQGSVTIAEDGAETKTGAAGALYDILKATAQAQAEEFGQGVPTGPEGKALKQGIADAANDHAQWIADQVAINDLGTVSSGTVVFDCTLAYHHKVTLGASSTLSMTNQKAGATYTFHILQDGTGSRTGNFLVGRFATGSGDETLSTVGNSHDVYVGASDGTLIWFHSVKKRLA